MRFWSGVLDRWGRSLFDMIGSLQELSTLGVGFVSLCEALDLTTPSGRALAGMLAIFAEFEREILRDRVKAGIAQARQQGKPHGRPPTVKAHSAEIKRLFGRGISKREIAKRLKIGRTSLEHMPTATKSWRDLQRIPVSFSELANNQRRLVPCPRCRSQPQYPWQHANCCPVLAETGAILRHIPITHRGEEAGRAVNHQAYGAA